MTTKRNAAQRLLTVAKKLGPQIKTTPVMKVWGTVLELEDIPEARREHEIATNLRLLHGQVQAVTNYANQAEIPPELFTRAMKQLDSGFSVINLNGQWETKAGQFDVLMQLTLGWLAHLMPDETNTITDSLRDELEKTLNNLNEILSVNDVPPSLKKFVEEQVEIIKKGLRQSNIIGPKAMADALYEGMTSASENTEVIKEHSESKAVSALLTAWKVVKKTPGMAIKTNNALGAAGGLAGKGLRALQFFQDLPSS